MIFLRYLSWETRTPRSMPHLKMFGQERHPYWSKRTPRIVPRWVCRGCTSGWWNTPFFCSDQSTQTWPHSRLEEKDGTVGNLIRHHEVGQYAHIQLSCTHNFRVDLTANWELFYNCFGKTQKWNCKIKPSLNWSLTLPEEVILSDRKN